MKYFIDGVEVSLEELNRFNTDELKQEDGYSEFLELDFIEIEKQEIHFTVSGVSWYG
jgi:hypothetical protein